MDSIAALFRTLGAPLHNERWSWGASTDDYVILRAWQDDMRKAEKGMRVLILKSIYQDRDLTNRNGYKEREKHIAEIEQGKSVYVVMCRAVDPKVQPRDIFSFEKKDLFVGGSVIRIEDESVELELVDRVSVREFRKQRSIDKMY